MSRARSTPFALLLLTALVAAPAALQGQTAKDPAARRLEREILLQLIEINTSDSAGGTPAAARAMADRLLAAGFPASDVRVLGYSERYQSLVARLRG
ncbi:MAG TPA: hypothetical protein VF187_00805, partial [Gemmatimonadales bacterium]